MSAIDPSRPATSASRSLGAPGDGASQLCLPLRTITPVFGGGYKPAQLDDFDPVRVPAIRGQLRFFWRALYGHIYTTPAALAKNERELWGGASSRHTARSQVAIWVLNAESIGAAQTKDASPPNSTSGYVLWPAGLGRTNDEGWAPRRKPGMRFCLHVRVAAAARAREHEVLAALRAWLLFGGIGARVRRGCGSLELDRVALTADSGQKIAYRDWLPASAEDRAIDAVLGVPCLTGEPAAPRTMPSLRGARLFASTPRRSATEAWEHAIALLKGFRRRLRPPKPSGGKVSSHILARMLAPAANLGLPIVNVGGNADTRLIWRDRSNNEHDRLASPMFIKPLALRDGTYAPVVLWLHRCDLDGDILWKNGDEGRSRETEATQYTAQELLARFEADFPRLDADARKQAGRDSQSRKRKPAPRWPRGKNKRRKRR